MSLSAKLDDVLGRLEAIDASFDKLEQENVKLKSKVSQLEERIDYLGGASYESHFLVRKCISLSAAYM